jgi:zinc transporter, ZIP family
MSTTQILILGAIAGGTIFLGLPIGRVRNTSTRWKAFLSSAAVGILLFLLIEVAEHGIHPVEEALEGAVDGGGSWARFIGLGLLFAAGVSAGLMVLVYYDRWVSNHRGRAMLGPGAASAAEYDRSWLVGLAPGHWLALLIATGIGLHNFSEGLAIGNSAAQDQFALALTLIIGFGLHNATEGFGIVAPMSGSEERPSWRFLGLLGLIGGGPTFIGTLVGKTFVSEAVSVGFLALAAGSLLYVIIQLVQVNQRFGHKTLIGWALLLGLFVGFGTEFVLEAAGA